MAHLMAVFRLLYMKNKLNTFMRVKNIALDLSQNRIPKITFADRSRFWWSKYICCGCIRSNFRASLDKKFVRKLLIIYHQLFTSGTFPNYIVTALAGFIGGIFVTYFYFTFVTIILDLSIPTAFYISIFVCICLTIGLAFIQSVRCIILSILPEICTYKARNMLISYALILLITGPGANILYNSRQLTQTITCTREQLNAVNKNLTEVYMKPLRALRQGVSNMVQQIKPVIETLKNTIIAIRDTVLALADIVKKVFNWLKGINSLCSNKIGTPFQLCYRMFENVIQDCEVRIFVPFNVFCNLGTVIQQNCYVLKVIDFFCQLLPFIADTIFDFVQDKIKTVGRFLKTMFYVSVSFHHSFAFETNESKSTEQILNDVFHAEENRLSYFFHILHVMKLILGAYIAYVLFSTFVYRQRFFRQLHYDNYHINHYLIDLDIRRALTNRQTILPLTYAEMQNYVSLFSLRLTIRERLNFLKDCVFLGITVLKFVFLYLIDISLHFILTLVDTHGKLQFSFGNDRAMVQAEGSGLWWTLHTYINELLKPFELEFHFDTQPCLPEPIPPAYHIYERVGYIIIFTAIMALFQPFGFRFRNYVMCQYYPESARRRAVWLYNYILQTRTNIGMYIKRQVMHKISFGLRREKPNFRNWLLTRYPRLGFILPYKNMNKECMVCGAPDPKVRCATPECPGTYCNECFKLMKETCMLCNMPQDLTSMDVSEEEDSETEEIITEDGQKSWWKFWILPSRQREEISLRDVEYASTSTDTFRGTDSVLKKIYHNLQTRDYFDDSWRRNDWASMEDFLIPLPDFRSWIRPELFVVVSQNQTKSVFSY